MTPEISYFIPGSLLEMDKYIEVVDGHFITAKQTGEVQIKMHDNNGKPFIATLYNLLFAPDLCDRLFSIIMLMNLGHTCLSLKWFCTFFFNDNEQNVSTLPYSAQGKYRFLVKIKGKVKITKSNS